MTSVMIYTQTLMSISCEYALYMSANQIAFETIKYFRGREFIILTM